MKKLRKSTGRNRKKRSNRILSCYEKDSEKAEQKIKEEVTHRRSHNCAI